MGMVGLLSNNHLHLKSLNLIYRPKLHECLPQCSRCVNSLQAWMRGIEFDVDGIPIYPLISPSNLIHPPYLYPSRPSSRERNTLNLHIHPFGQLLHRHATPRRLAHKPLLVLAVQLAEVGHVRQKHVDLDDLLDRGVGGGEDGLDVGAAGGRLLGDGAGDEIAGGRGGYLARDVDD